MAKKAARKTVRLAKGAAIFWGAVMTLALVLGAGTVALAAVPGDPFGLGQTNSISGALTALVGSNDGAAMLKVDNNSSAGGSRALDLRVEPGKQPINVNAEAGKATNLDADKLDGMNSDEFIPNVLKGTFMPRRTYVEWGGRRVDDQGGFVTSRARCDDGDVALAGGHAFTDRWAFDFDFEILEEEVSGEEYAMTWNDESAAGNVGSSAGQVNVTCADFMPWHLTPMEADVDPGPIVGGN